MADEETIHVDRHAWDFWPVMVNIQGRRQFPLCRNTKTSRDYGQGQDPTYTISEECVALCSMFIDRSNEVKARHSLNHAGFRRKVQNPFTFTVQVLAAPLLKSEVYH